MDRFSEASPTRLWRQQASRIGRSIGLSVGVLVSIMISVPPSAATAADGMPLPDRRPTAERVIAKPFALAQIEVASTTSGEVGSEPEAATKADGEPPEIRDPDLIRIPPIRRVNPVTPPRPPALSRWLSKF